MSTASEFFLEHYGVKGMKWGVRKDRSKSSGKSADKEAKKANKKTKKQVKQDLKWAKKASTMRQQVRVYNEMARLMNEKGLGEVNSNPAFKGKKPLLDNDMKTRQLYLDTINKTATKYAQKAHRNVNGNSPNGQLDVKYTYDSKAGVTAVIATPGEIDHAAPTKLNVEVKDGFIVKIGEAALSHDGELGEFLEHYGVKGMRWGVRRSDSELRAAKQERKAAKKGYKNAKKQVKLTKKQGKLDRSDEKIGRTKAGGSKPVDRMSTEELREAVSRMNLESQYSRLRNESSTKKRGESFIAEQVQKAAGQAINNALKSAFTSALNQAGSSGAKAAKKVKNKVTN